MNLIDRSIDRQKDRKIDGKVDKALNPCLFETFNKIYNWETDKESFRLLNR